MTRPTPPSGVGLVIVLVALLPKRLVLRQQRSSVRLGEWS